MKKVFFGILCLMLLVITPIQAADKTVTFGWNYNQADYDKVTGFKLYRGDSSDATNTQVADIPVAEITPADPSATILDFEKAVPLTLPDNAVTTVFFSLTAYNDNGESGKSETISAVWDFVLPPAVADLVANYDDASGMLTFSWTYPTDWLEKIARWELFQSDTSGGPYTKVVDIPYDPNASQPYTTDVELQVPTGSKVTKYYTLVAHRPAENNSVFSADSNEVTVTINRMPPKAPFEFKIKIK